jgi:hypothetical protein
MEHGNGYKVLGIWLVCASKPNFPYTGYLIPNTDYLTEFLKNSQNAS